MHKNSNNAKTSRFLRPIRPLSSFNIKEQIKETANFFLKNEKKN
jgi:hypothetical protein